MSREIKFRAWVEFDKYEIGDDGSVFSKAYKNTFQRKQMKHCLDKDGYPYVFFVKNKKRYKRIIHRMVALLFVDNLDNKPIVNHKNGIRNDNRADNLEWVTHKENVIHSFQSNGRKPSQASIEAAKVRFSGARNPKAKLNEAQVLSIRQLRAKGVPLKDIAERIGISRAQVSAIARGRSWNYSHPELLNKS